MAYVTKKIGLEEMHGQEGKRCADCLFWPLWQINFHIFIMREIYMVIAFLWPM